MNPKGGYASTRLCLAKMKYYAGIGSRETPNWLIPTISEIVRWCENEGIILRSGGADGADLMFESAIQDPEMKEIYLPWKDFNNNKSNLFKPTTEAMEIAEHFHPAWYKLSFGAKKLMARNTHQILGVDCETPSSFVVCWTPEGKYQGGTSQAMRIADHYKIPIINLFNNDYEDIIEKIKNIII